MIGVLSLRVALDFAAVALIIACLAYWWLDNLSHELFGTALFALVIIHNVFNRRWFKTIGKRQRDPLRLFNLATIVCLATGMTIMLATSLLISRDLFSFASLKGAFAVREIHMFAAYWVLLILAIHLGTRWRVVMNIVGGPFAALQKGRAGRVVMRLASMVIAVAGVRASFDMGFGTKLLLTYSLDMWDFSESTLGFFVNYALIVGLWVVVTHYAGLLVKLLGVRRRSAT